MPKSWKAESANYPFRRILHLEFLIVAQSAEQGSERLFSVCLFDPGHFDLVDSMVGPEGKWACLEKTDTEVESFLS